MLAAPSPISSITSYPNRDFGTGALATSQDNKEEPLIEPLKNTFAPSTTQHTDRGSPAYLPSTGRWSLLTYKPVTAMRIPRCLFPPWSAARAAKAALRLRRTGRAGRSEQAGRRPPLARGRRVPTHHFVHNFALKSVSARLRFSSSSGVSSFFSPKPPRRSETLEST